MVCRMPWICEASAGGVCAAPAEPVDRPCTTRSRALCSCSTPLVRLESIVPSQPSPSSALREYCWTRLMSPRACIAATVPPGESDGRASCFPLDSCACSSPSLERLFCRLPRAALPIERSVTRIWRVMVYLPPTGVVDQRVQGAVHGGQHPGGGLVGALVRHHVRHLLVEAHE